MKNFRNTSLFYYAGLPLLFFSMSCSDIIPTPTSQPNTSTPTTSSNSSGNPTSTPTTSIQRTITAPETFFMASQRRTFSKNGDWVTEGFSISKQTTFMFRVATQYKAQVAIITEGELNNFKTMNAFRGYGIFDNTYGYTSVTIPAGKYYVAVRNTSTGSNIVSYELDIPYSFPASDRIQFYDNYISGVKSWNGGAKMWHPFTIQNGFRYFIDGCNTGFDTYIIPESELGNFQNGQQFKVYSDYTQTPGAGPGFFEVKLPPGTYYFVATNSTSASQAIVYLMERWRLN